MITDRSSVRAEIAALFSDITELQAVYAYPPLQLLGQSPVLTIHGNGSLPRMVSAAVNQFDHHYIISIYVNREAHGAEESENLLDSIFTKVMQAIRDNISGTTFTNIVADSRTQPSFAIIDGKQYRVEEISVYTRSNPNG